MRVLQFLRKHWKLHSWTSADRQKVFPDSKSSIWCEHHVGTPLLIRHHRKLYLFVKPTTKNVGCLFRKSAQAHSIRLCLSSCQLCVLYVGWCRMYNAVNVILKKSQCCTVWKIGNQKDASMKAVYRVNRGCRVSEVLSSTVLELKIESEASDTHATKPACTSTPAAPIVLMQKIRKDTACWLTSAFAPG